MTKYKLLRSWGNTLWGEIVYRLQYYDYGLASDDTRMTGIEHISVTYKEDGSHPSFTIPKAYLEEIE